MSMAAKYQALAPGIVLVELGGNGHSPGYLTWASMAFESLGFTVAHAGPPELFEKLRPNEKRPVILADDLGTRKAAAGNGFNRMRANYAWAFRLRRAIRHWERSASVQVVLVYFPTLDYALWSAHPFRWLAPLFPWKVSGNLVFPPVNWVLRDQPKRVRSDGYDGLGKPPFRDFGTINPLAVDGCEKHLGVRPVKFPEYTDLSVPSEDATLLPSFRVANREKVVKARGKIVGLYGFISPRKQPLQFARMARAGRDRDWLFLIWGKIAWNRLKDYEARELAEIIRSGLPNLVVEETDAERADPELNWLIERTGLLFILYNTPEHGSNLLTKASHFRVPVICLDAGFIGHAARKYHLGFPVSEPSAVDLAELIPELALRHRASPLFESGASQFAAENSREALRSSLVDLLGRMGIPIPAQVDAIRPVANR